jgi:transposase
MIKNSVVYVGVDVHKDTNSVCMYDPEDSSFFAEARLDAGTDNICKYLKKQTKDFGLEDKEFIIGYEAGPTGFGLQRGLTKKGYTCYIMAPTTIKKASGEKTKTDRKDARMLAMTLATDAYKQVHVPEEEDEATKELTRTRGALKKHLKRAKQNLLSFLLRQNKSYPFPGSYWTQRFTEWLNSLAFTDKWLQLSLETYRTEVRELNEKIEQMDALIEEAANSERYKENVDKLICFTGIDIQTALSILCEIGDFSRFPSPDQFASFLGLVPGQESSGKTIRFTGITKTGNSRLRLLLIEAVKAIKRSSPYNKSKRIKERQMGQSPEVIAYADKGTKRIKAKMKSMEERGKNANVSTAAGARELACFIWGMMTGNIA